GNVDARQLPRIKEAEDGSFDNFADTRYDTSATIAEAAAFYRTELAKLGWKERKGRTDASRDWPNGNKQLGFDKYASVVKIDISKSKDAEVNVRIQSRLLGDLIAGPNSPQKALAVIDLRKFPRLGGAPASSATSARAQYAASGSVADAVRFYRQE